MALPQSPSFPAVYWHRPTASPFKMDTTPFRILDWINQIGASMKLAVMKTSAPPISVRLNGQTPTTPTSDDSVNIGILTNQPKSVEERIYLRWSTDFFITSHMVEAAGSGLNYSATIPAQPAGTGVQVPRCNING